MASDKIAALAQDAQLKAIRRRMENRERAVYALMDLREAIETSSPDRLEEVLENIYHALDKQLDYLLALDDYPELKLNRDAQDAMLADA